LFWLSAIPAGSINRLKEQNIFIDGKDISIVVPMSTIKACERNGGEQAGSGRGCFTAGKEAPIPNE